LCRECFFTAFEEEVYSEIVQEQLLRRGERIAIGASGGKDSTVLAHVLTTLNKRYEWVMQPLNRHLCP
jgi:cytoplasmic tRNA 2-thiolation protein 1